MNSRQDLLTLEDFQKIFLNYCNENIEMGHNNPISHMITLFLILCHEEGLNFLKGYDNYFNELVHLLIVIRESGLSFENIYENSSNVLIKNKL